MRLEHLLSGAGFSGKRSTAVRPVDISSHGGLAQLARASALHAEGQRFDSVILHPKEHNDMMEARGVG